MLTERPYHFTHLLKGFKEIPLKSDFIHFFHDLNHACSPRAVGIQPQGTKF